MIRRAWTALALYCTATAATNGLSVIVARRIRRRHETETFHEGMRYVSLLTLERSRHSNPSYGLITSKDLATAFDPDRAGQRRSYLRCHTPVIDRRHEQQHAAASSN